jgi:hypothetical protein
MVPTARIHNVFHVAFLKKYDGAALAVIPPLSPIVHGRAAPRPQQVVHAGQHLSHEISWSSGRTAHRRKGHGNSLRRSKKLTQTFGLRTCCFTWRG